MDSANNELSRLGWNVPSRLCMRQASQLREKDAPCHSPCCLTGARVKRPLVKSDRLLIGAFNKHTSFHYTPSPSMEYTECRDNHFDQACQAKQTPKSQNPQRPKETPKIHNLPITHHTSQKKSNSALELTSTGGGNSWTVADAALVIHFAVPRHPLVFASHPPKKAPPVFSHVWGSLTPLVITIADFERRRLIVVRLFGTVVLLVIARPVRGRLKVSLARGQPRR